MKARLKQAGGKSVELAFNQKQEVLANDYDIKNGNCTFFQWGRKDPMLPGDGITAGIGKDKTCFTTDTQYAFQHTGLETSDIKEYIRNPHKFNTKVVMDGQYYNLWSTDNDKTYANDDKVIKSVYDPSPVGYSLPASNVATGFTTTGGNTSNPAEYNVYGVFDKGWYFYTKKNKQGSTIFFPAAGYRLYSSGSLYAVTTHCYYLVAGPIDGGSGRCLYFYSGYVLPLNRAFRSVGFPVRSAEEKKWKYVCCRKLQMVFGLREVYDA